MLEIKSAMYVEAYKIRLLFNNGEEGVVDLQDSLWGPMFEPLRELGEFKRFAVSKVLHTICWDNNADLAPEFLYNMLLDQSHIE
ncbi:MAG: DUF2442 domain-containing protein [Candidatus Omnitrophota bacterium]|jgi:hypothetical protein|nr:MAG: DUF2442 domain-containing protein [Candidatus Omnitrophota bacterium]